ncbi:MAG: thiol reductant ABC exporter subunit CydC [Collinsella sp.]|nr:thiol reductant ABC exporter subunit CydC [Collinsella sp.]
MFDPRLIRLAPQVAGAIIASIIARWVALLMNIAIIMALGDTAAALLEAGRGSLVAALAAPAALGAPLPLALAFSIVVRSLAIAASQRAGDEAALAAKRAIRQRVYDKLAAMGPAYAERVSTAEAVQTSVEGAQQLEVYFGGYLPQLAYAVIAPITLFCALVGRAPLPALVLLVIVPLIPASIMVVMRRAKRAAGAYWESYVDLGGSFLEALQGLTTLKIYEADGRWHERMNAESEGFRQATMRMLRVQLSSITVMDLVAFGGAAAGIVLAVFELAAGRIGFAAAFSVVFLSQEFFLPMRRLGSLFHTAMNGMSAARTMFKILDAPEPDRGGDKIAGAGDIVLEDVGYAYGERTVLSGVTCTIPARGLTAIVGGSGSGKSTLAGALSGRLAGYRGRLTVGGTEVRDAELGSLMRAVTLVPTNAHLFMGTLRENLLMAKSDATDEELMAALARARIDGFVRASGGLGMMVAEGASNLSGGQRQRIAVARALLADTPVYIFDEATSNVDAESERALNELMAELAGERAVIVIAHRLASIEGADKILVIDGGRLAEEGAHADLLARGGAYARLWESQAELEAALAGGAGARAEDAGASCGGAAGAAGDAVAARAEGAGSSAVSAGAPGDAAPGDAATGPKGAGSGAAAEASGAVSGAGAARPASAPAGAPRTGEDVPGGRAASASTPRSGLSVMARMLALVGPLAPLLVLAVVLGSAGSLAATFVAGFGAFGLVAAAGRDLSLGVALAVTLVAACGAVRGPLHYGEQLCNHDIAFRLLAHIRDLVFAALRRLAPAKLEGRGRGDLISLITADIELLEVFFAHTISPVAIAVVTGAAMLAFIASFSPVLAALALAGYLLIGVVLPAVSARLCGQAGRASRDAAGAISAFVLDSLRGLSESVQFGAVGARSRDLDRRTADAAGVERALARRMAALEAAADALLLLVSLVMGTASVHLAAVGAISIEAAFVCTFAYFSSFGPMLAVARLGTSLQATIASGARVLDLLDEVPEVEEISTGSGTELRPDAFTGASLADVDFTYGTGERVLADISLEIPRGLVTCVSGASGSGKSTLLKLLMRFWDATEGVVRVSGEDVRDIETASLRACEGYMTQDTHLLTGTLRDNLLIAREGADEDELWDACRAAALTGLIERLPEGLDTPVAELGSSLSGGERQRLGLARVFLHDAPLILLDEPTSNLDALSEAAVMRSVARLKERGKTIVLVSHRASTVSFADRVVSVEGGRLS